MKSKNHDVSRREFISHTAKATTGILVLNQFIACSKSQANLIEKPGSKMKFGLVTYLWGKDWDLETLIKNRHLPTSLHRHWLKFLLCSNNHQ